MQKKKQILPQDLDEKEKIDSLDFPYEDTGSPENALENDDEAEQDDLISKDREEEDNTEDEEDFVWEPGRQPNQRED